MRHLALTVAVSILFAGAASTFAGTARNGKSENDRPREAKSAKSSSKQHDEGAKNSKKNGSKSTSQAKSSSKNGSSAKSSSKQSSAKQSGSKKSDSKQYGSSDKHRGGDNTSKKKDSSKGSSNSDKNGSKNGSKHEWNWRYPNDDWWKDREEDCETDVPNGNTGNHDEECEEEYPNGNDTSYEECEEDTREEECEEQNGDYEECEEDTRDEECEEQNGDYEPDPNCEEEYDRYEECEDTVPLSFNGKWNSPSRDWWNKYGNDEECEEDLPRYDECEETYDPECDNGSGVPTASNGDSSYDWRDPECEPTGPAAAAFVMSAPSEEDGDQVDWIGAGFESATAAIAISGSLVDVVAAQPGEAVSKSAADEVFTASSEPIVSALGGAAMASAAIPEPSTALLALMALAALAVARPSRRK